jgi:5S rRNA maturation endonuclease (ribonuclease M5)
MRNSQYDEKDRYENDYAPTYSSRGTIHDYLTLGGIELRTQIAGYELYNACLGEKMDNSIDYMETHGVRDPQVKVTVSTIPLNKEKSLVNIIVRNSVNPESDHVFSKDLLELIYNFKVYYSSKRFFKINRGALGDASKLMLGAPYALADSMNIDLRDAGIAHPITHKTSTKGTLKTFHISLSSDAETQVIEDLETPSEENYTEVQILLPCNSVNSYKIERELFYYLRDYAFLNTHIGIIINLPSSPEPMRFPATQSMINSGKNLSDIRFYGLPEFRQAIKELHDKNQRFYDVFLANFRGANNIPKNDLTLATIGELEKSSTKIEGLFELVHEKTTPISSEIGLASMIPFATKMKTRMMALQERLGQFGISCDHVKYKQKFDYYKSYDGKQYPYFIEVFVGHSKDIQLNLKVVQSINSKISKDNLVFGGPYHYGTDSIKFVYQATSILGIFEHFRYSFDDKKCKKPNSIIIVNLISPRINYKSHGKSRIDHTPFAKTIANTIVKACKGGDNKNGKVDQIEGLREVLRKRKAEFLAIMDPIERKKREWTQSDVFYATRFLLITEYGYTDQEINRDYLTGKIREECEKLGVTREEIGLIAADRAQLYYNGKWTNVGLDEIETQVDYGTDMTIIEKEGVIVQISLFSNRKRIALLNTRGFLVEYASKLARLANERGCNISIIVDWDVSGLLIYLKVKKIVPSIKRIGVDFKTLEDLGLRAEDVEEKYDTTNNKHLDALNKELEEALERGEENGIEEDIEEFTYIKNNLYYLKENRIEINSITVRLNDNAKFWNWIEDKQRFWFPDRDFTRSANVPEYVEPDELLELNNVIRQKGTAALEPQREELQEKLRNNNIKNAFLFDRTNKIKPDYDFDDYDAAIAEQSKEIEVNNDEVKPYLIEIRKILDEMKDKNKAVKDSMRES